MTPARGPTRLAGTLPVIVTVAWFVETWLGLSSTGETGTATGLGLGVDGDGRTAPVIPETVSPTAETIRGRAPLSVNRTTAPSATMARASTALAARGRPRGVSGARRGWMRGTNGPRGAGETGRGLPEEGGRGRTWLGRPRRDIIGLHCRTTAPCHPPPRRARAPLDGVSGRPASAVKLRCWTVRCTLARIRHVWERSVRCVREWRKGMRRAARGRVPSGRQSGSARWPAQPCRRVTSAQAAGPPIRASRRSSASGGRCRSGRAR